MGKKLTALQVATYIANSSSFDEVAIFQDYLDKHPKTKFYAGKILNKNDACSGELLKPGNESQAEEFFELVKREPLPKGLRPPRTIKKISLEGWLDF
jgi:hypothetical protein